MQMNANFTPVRGADLQSVGSDFRVLTKIYGSLLGPEYVVFADDKYWRIGELSLSQLKRGVQASDLELLEVDENGDPVEGGQEP